MERKNKRNIKMYILVGQDIGLGRYDVTIPYSTKKNGIIERKIEG